MLGFLVGPGVGGKSARRASAGNPPIQLPPEHLGAVKKMAGPKNSGNGKSVEDEAFGPVVLTADEVLTLNGSSRMTVAVSAPGGDGSGERQRALEARLKKYR